MTFEFMFKLDMIEILHSLLSCLKNVFIRRIRSLGRLAAFEVENAIQKL